MNKKNYPDVEPHKKRSIIIRGLWFTGGTICLVLGAIGLFLPILPTTPFLLASTACYYKSSLKMHKWLIHNKWFGDYIRNYQEGKGMPIRTKIIALTVLWVTIGVSTFFFLERSLPTFLVQPMQLTMIITVILVTMYILRLPTYKNS